MPAPQPTGKRQRTLFGRPLGIVLILLQKAVWGVVLVAMAVGLFVIFRMHITQPVQLLFQDELSEDPHDFLAHLLIGLLPGLALRTELLLATEASSMPPWKLWRCVACGLWRDVLWVEMLIVVETAALLPYEGWELAHHVTPFRMISTAISLLILWYLVARYLRMREARHAEVPQAAGSGILAHDPASPLVIGTDGRHRSRSSA